jgi:RecG-like helicase
MKSRADSAPNHSSDLEKVTTPAVRAKLIKLGVVRAQDLLTFFPIRYEDETQVFNIS